MHLQMETMMMVCAPYTLYRLFILPFPELNWDLRLEIASVQSTSFLIRKGKVDIGVDSRHCYSVGAVIIVAFSRRAHVS